MVPEPTLLVFLSGARWDVDRRGHIRVRGGLDGDGFVAHDADIDETKVGRWEIATGKAVFDAGA